MSVKPVSATGLAQCLHHSGGCLLSVQMHREGLCPSRALRDIPEQRGCGTGLRHPCLGVPDTGIRPNWGRGEG